MPEIIFEFGFFILFCEQGKTASSGKIQNICNFEFFLL